MTDPRGTTDITSAIDDSSLSPNALCFLPDKKTSMNKTTWNIELACQPENSNQSYLNLKKDLPGVACPQGRWSRAGDLTVILLRTLVLIPSCPGAYLTLRDIRCFCTP